MARLLVLLIAAALLAATPAHADEKPVLAAIEKLGASDFAALLRYLDIKVPANTTGTLLVPTDKAVAAFLAGMNLTKPELLARKELVDLALAYHFIPGHQAKSLDFKSPAVAVSGDVNYILRFYKNASSAWVEDVQGNNVTLRAKPTLVGGLSLVPVDRVLMSGGYFDSKADALAHYPQWAAAAELAEKAGFPTEFANNLTMFVPANASAAEFAKLDKAGQAAALNYHFVKGAMTVGGGLKSGRYETLAKGHFLTVDVKPNATSGVPTVTVTPEDGKPVSVKVFNIYAGRSILQGVDGPLSRKLSGAASKEAPKPAATTPAAKPATAAVVAAATKEAPVAKPAAAAVVAAATKEAPAAAAKPAAAAVVAAATKEAPAAAAKPAATAVAAVAAAAPDAPKAGRRMLLSQLVVRAARTLLGRGGRNYSRNDSGFNQMTANSIAATNTQFAIRAAADGSIPTGAATHYGSYQAQQAASYGNCWNCRSWR